MFKKLALFSISSISQIAMAATPINLYQAPLSSLMKYSFIQKAMTQNLSHAMAASDPNQLLIINQTNTDDKTIVRYQQLYKSIPVVGAQVMITSKNKTGPAAVNVEPRVNGHLFDEIDLDTRPTINSQEAINLARKIYLAQNPQSTTTAENGQLQIRSTEKNALQLVYLVSFKSFQTEDIFAWPFFIIDAHTGTVIKQWNNIKTYDDSGPGGNDKVHQYWYGKDNLPSIKVIQKNESCEMDDSIVRLVNLNSSWDWGSIKINSYKYPCGNNIEDRVNGAFSPINDAYYFGHTIVDMYKEWYGYHALQSAEGKPMRLIMRVHFGQNYDNAFWDGKTMSFGDGDSFYPLTSLDVAGHEVSHGFTEQHSGLEYHDESGALNESFSDMAGQASRAFLLERNPALYNKSNIVSGKVTWGIGETVVKDDFGYKALRFMDNPSADDNSADCLDKDLAKNAGAQCKISYNELVETAKRRFSDPESQQGYIVHTASGIFNKAFYLLSEKIGIKNAYHIMLLANSSYWTPTTDFTKAACGVLYAANDLKSDTNTVKSVFEKVGIDTRACGHLPFSAAN